MNKYALQQWFGEPWAILPEALEQLIQHDGDPVKGFVNVNTQAEREGRQACAFVTGASIEPYDHSFAMARVGSKAILPIVGFIRPAASTYMHAAGYVTSLSLAGRDFQRALEDPDIDEIILAIDSPGGIVTGNSDFSQMVYDARGTKKVTAFVDGYGASAGYYIASSAEEVVVSAQAQLGSIGTQMTYVDWSKFDEQTGIQEIVITSSQSPFKNAAPTNEEGRKRLQARADALAQVFIEDVARNRGVSIDQVLEEFGQGDLFVGEQAVTAGLADRVGSFHKLLGVSKDGAMVPSQTVTGGPSMDIEKLAAMVQALTPGKPCVLNAMTGAFVYLDDSQESIALVAPDAFKAAVDAAAAEAKVAGVEEGRQAALTLESERIAQIDEAFKDNALAKPVADAMKATPGVTVDQINAVVVAKLASGELRASGGFTGQDDFAPDALQFEHGPSAAEGAAAPAGNVAVFPADMQAALERNAASLNNKRGAK